MKGKPMSDKKLNLDKKNLPPQTPEEAQAAIAEYYTTIGNCALNMTAALHKIAEMQEQILVELSDIKDNFNKQGVSEGWLNEVEIEEREREADPEPPKNRE
jgi:hypothetical protein